jgi:quercetin dioxygenase-like cupin family protein
VRPGEAWRIHNPAADPIRLFVSQGPGAEGLVWLDTMPDDFEADLPVRLAEVDAAERHGMGSRWFQMLVDKTQGSTVVTQFIGNIPFSKAEPHQHLYEEALIFLNGAGVVWTERTRTIVSAGDVLFLPRKQVHSVQCTVEGGFDVVGVIYPGDNPSINY